MTSHPPSIDLSHDQPPLPNQHFSSWLRSQTTLFISQIVAILGSISLIASTIYYVSHIGEDKGGFTLLTVKLIVDYAHLAFIAVFILVLIHFLDDNERGDYRVSLVYERVFKKPKQGEKGIEDAKKTGKKQLGIFKRRFLWFWIGMLCLYVCFAGQHTYEASLEPRNKPDSKDVTVSYTGRVQGKEEKGDLRFNIIEETHDATAENRATDIEKPIPKIVPRLRTFSSLPYYDDPRMVKIKLSFAFAAFFFNNVTLLVVFWCFLVMYIRPDEVEEKEWKYKVGSVVVVSFLILSCLLFLVLKRNEFTDDSAEAYVAIFDALSGVVNAVVLALLIARLDSKQIGLPSWLISILYSYAAVQPLFIVFELRDSYLMKIITTLVLIFVFVFKIYFFLIIFYALQTGKMLNYLTCFPIFRNRADSPARRAQDGEHLASDGERASVFKRLRTFACNGFKRLRTFGPFSTSNAGAKTLEATQTCALVREGEERPPVGGTRAARHDGVPVVEERLVSADKRGTRLGCDSLLFRRHDRLPSASENLRRLWRRPSERRGRFGVEDSETIGRSRQWYRFRSPRSRVGHDRSPVSRAEG